MLSIVTAKQKRGLERAVYQFKTARSLGHSGDSAYTGAVLAYMAETGEPRDRAETAVQQFLAIEPEILGGTL